MVIVTNTLDTPHVKYINRPKPVARTYRCDQCDTIVTLYVDPIEVTHRCKQMQKPGASRVRALKAS